MRLTHSRSTKLYNYTLDGRTLETTNSHPYLGISINKDLSWTTHVNNITSSATRSLGFIRRNLYSCPKSTKQTPYMALVRPLTKYSSSVWDPHHTGLIKKLESVQKRSARFVTNTHDRKKQYHSPHQRPEMGHT